MTSRSCRCCQSNRRATRAKGDGGAKPRSLPKVVLWGEAIVDDDAKG